MTIHSPLLTIVVTHRVTIHLVTCISIEIAPLKDVDDVSNKIGRIQKHEVSQWMCICVTLGLIDLICHNATFIDIEPVHKLGSECVWDVMISVWSISLIVCNPSFSLLEGCSNHQQQQQVNKKMTMDIHALPPFSCFLLLFFLCLPLLS